MLHIDAGPCIVGTTKMMRNATPLKPRARPKRTGAEVNRWRQRREEWMAFVKGQTLCLFAHENEGVKTEQTPHGVLYVVDGPLTAPDGTRLDVRSVGLTLR
jgi:hypothetical protein